MWDKPAVTEHDGIADGVQIDLSAEAAYALAGVPMDELTNRVVEVGELDTVDVDRLAQPTARDAVGPRRAGGARRGHAGGPSDVGRGEVGARSSCRSVPTPGSLPSRRQWAGRRSRLVDRFRREIGVPPKTVRSHRPVPLARSTGWRRCDLTRTDRRRVPGTRTSRTSTATSATWRACTPGELLADIRPRPDAEDALTLSA